MMNRVSLLGAPIFVASLVVAASPIACDGDATSPDAIDQNGEADAGGASPAGGSPVYGLVVNTFTPTSRTSYVLFVDSLESQPDVTLAEAREFPNYAPVAASGGKLFVGSGESPSVNRYVIGDDKSWTDDGSISFSGYASAPVQDSIHVGANVAYAPVDAATYVRWDPTTFALGATVTLPPSLVPASLPGGYALTRGFAYLTSGALAYQSFYYQTTAYAFEPTSYIGILDSSTNAWTGAIKVGCPHLHVGSADDAGTMYFGPSIGSVATAVVDSTAPRNCMIRVKAGATVADGSPLFFKDLTEGREGSNFFYASGTTGVFSAYHQERATPAELANAQNVGSSSNFHLWTLDLATNTAKMMDGIDYGGGQFASFRFGGRVFIAMPKADYSETTIFEITKEGRAERRFSSQGWVYGIVKVR